MVFTSSRMHSQTGENKSVCQLLGENKSVFIGCLLPFGICFFSFFFTKNSDNDATVASTILARSVGHKISRYWRLFLNKKLPPRLAGCRQGPDTVQKIRQQCGFKNFFLLLQNPLILGAPSGLLKSQIMPGERSDFGVRGVDGIYVHVCTREVLSLKKNNFLIKK